MSTVLASNGVALLQRDFLVAVATEVVDGGVGVESGVATRLRRHDGDLVDFARHGYG
jgi:hypothetical protein